MNDEKIKKILIMKFFHFLGDESNFLLAYKN